ncbi:MAG TPA: hypothetical protein VFA78_05685 [Chloroflexota bacterium]|nr:hypothetical protein [Chloroflexota bacterium]
MRRLALSLCVVALLVVGAGYRHTSADDITVFNGSCFASPSNTLIPCSTLTPTAPPPLVEPVKELGVGGGTTGPYGVTGYPVNLTSTFVCFALNEPINVYTLGSPGATALTPLFPDPDTATQNAADSVTTYVDAATGQAQLELEVRNSSVGPEGVVVKAVWPQEGVERLVTVISGSATATPAPTTTATPTGTPPPTATPAPTATATPVSSSGPFTAQACVQPSVLRGYDFKGGSGILYGRTTPGATCTAGISYYNNPHSYIGGPTSTEFDGTVQTAAADGLVTYPLTEDSKADYGIALVTCVPPTIGSRVIACAAFLVAQNATQDLLTEDTQTTASKLEALQASYCPKNSVHT